MEHLNQDIVEHRIGLIKVSAELYKTQGFSDLLSFINFVPIEVHLRKELIYNGRLFEMTGYSNCFPSREIGDIIPEYRIAISRDDEGNIFSVCAERQNC